jgi:hypothetical protein
MAGTGFELDFDGSPSWAANLRLTPEMLHAFTSAQQAGEPMSMTLADNGGVHVCPSIVLTALCVWMIGRPRLRTRALVLFGLALGGSAVTAALRARASILNHSSMT